MSASMLITPTYRFYIQDHLGNNRMAVHQSGTIEQVNNYYPYGSEYDGVKGSVGGQLGRRYYSQDKQVINEGYKNENLKQRIKIPVPAGMTSAEFDQRIIDVANSFGNNPSITYFMTPFTETQGNCNTSTSTILQKSGGKYRRHGRYQR